MTVIGDILVVETMKKTGFTIEEYSKRHHGGYLGDPFWALAIWVSYLIVATPMHRHKTLAEPNADAMDDNNETEEQH